MGHGHQHGHDHSHPHTHDHGGESSAATDSPALDLSIPDSELSPAALSRRGMLRGAGLLGAGLAGVGAVNQRSAEAAAAPSAGPRAAVANTGSYRWLAGDHHIHTQYSPDGQYRVSDQVRHASNFGLDWMVITDHGSVAHAKLGVDKVNPDIRRARAATPDMLVFQGLEWNIPAAEHATVIVTPGANEVSTLKEFENSYDGNLQGAGASTPANEALAISGLSFLARQVRSGRVQDAVMLANHPARNGIDSPHEIRNWRDLGGGIAIGMEGAPGHQAAGIPEPAGPGGGRGAYGNAPGPNSFAGYPLASYRTFGGFDWMTSTVGGLWDSLLAEGKPWWISANSDAHQIWNDLSKNPVDNDRDAPWDAEGHTFDNFGRYGDPIYAGGPETGNGDFWPGYYSRTHVGAASSDYVEVMRGLRAGRVWVDHGGLLDSIEVRAKVTGTAGPGTTLGGVLNVQPGDDVTVTVTITPASGPNQAQFQPELAQVDVIAGTVLGPVSDRDAISTPNTRVFKSYDVSGRRGTFTLTYTQRDVQQPFYFRLRGSDGNRLGVGYLGRRVDPSGPVMDVVGDADPWTDLWFYTNPIWVLPPSPLDASVRTARALAGATG